MKEKAIIFTAFYRLDYFKETLFAWSRVEGIKDYDIYFRVEPSRFRSQMIALIDEFSQENSIRCNVILNESQLGCGKNTWLAFDEMFAMYNFVILAEDDIAPSKDLLKFFNYLEAKYRDDEAVAVISANNEVEGFNPAYVSRKSHFRGHIWGTWRKYWNQYIRDTWDFAYDTAVDNGPSGWDWNMGLRVFPQNNLVTISPHSARSQHIGVDGLHSNKDVYEYTYMKSFQNNYEWDELIEV